jgi:hypothetical protein
MLFNAEIETIFNGFKVNNVSIPVKYLFYEGHNEPYIVYTQIDTTNSYSTDDEIAGVVAVYDFDIYSKGNYVAIAEAVKNKLKKAGWTWQPNRDSQDLYDVDTGYYHKTFCFAKQLQIIDEEA